MKKLMTAALLLLCALPALAEFDMAGLKQQEDFLIMMAPGSWDMLYCPMNQPYQGEMEDAWLDVSIDFVEKVDIDMTLIRVAVRVEVFDNLYADTIAFTVGEKTYAFAVSADVFEYDGVYQETYVTCLTDESLAFLKALAQQRQDAPIPLAFIAGGEEVAAGRIVIPGEEAARLYDLFIDLDGRTQDLKGIAELYPCTITKAK